MKITVEKSLMDVRTQLRALPPTIAGVKTSTDRQKLLVSTVQEVNEPSRSVYFGTDILIFCCLITVCQTFDGLNPR